MNPPKAKLKKRLVKPYKHDVSVCINKIRKTFKESDTTIVEIEFELSSIHRFGSRPERYATGQAISIYRKNKKNKEVKTKTFIQHDFCPYCGKKF